MLKKSLSSVLRYLDKAYLGIRLGLGIEPLGIRVLLFHTVLTEEAERENHSILPHQALTLRQYRFIFEYLKCHGYEFIGHDDLYRNLEPNKRYAYVSFDDGYFNNARLLPLAEELGVPIHFFVTTENVIEQKKYWWDVVYSEGIKGGLDVVGIKRVIAYLKTLTPEEIDDYLSRKYGMLASIPSGDLDRPLTSGELAHMATHKLVTIGNHTHRHAIATNLTPIQFRAELDASQLVFEEILGYRPTSFAFPNGNFSGSHLKVCESAGLKMGFGWEEKKIDNLDSYTHLDRLCLGRFGIYNSLQLKWQVDMIRSTSSIYRSAQRTLKRWRSARSRGAA